MHQVNRLGMNRTHRFRVRGSLLIGGAFVLCVAFLPGIVSGSYILKRAFLISASAAIATGWFFLFKDHEPNSTWRVWLAGITSVYLTVCLPAFLFEMSQIKWLMLHPMHRLFSMYVSPWVHFGFQGLLFVAGGVLGSLFGRGRARVAFLVGATLLLILRIAIGDWVY
jgi:hypothetical protein